MNKKNILIISPSLDPEDNISGISSIVRLLVEYNDDVNYIPFIQGKKDKDSRSFKWLLKQLFTPFRLLNLLFRTHIDIIHFNIGFEPLSLIRDLGIYWILKMFSYPILLHIHGGRYLTSKPQKYSLKLVIAYFLRHADMILVLGCVEKKSLSKQYGIDMESIHVLANAVLSSPLTVSEKPYQSILSILYLGRVDKNKGLVEILKVMEGLENQGLNFCFYLCGVGPDKEWFVSECSKIIGNKLIDKGLIYGKEKQLILNLSHIFLLPSYFEGLPMALLESMNNLVVPVVSPVGSIPDVVVQGKNGFLISSPREIINVINNLNSNRDLLLELSISAKDTICKHYSLDCYLKKMNMYYNLLKQ